MSFEGGTYTIVIDKNKEITSITFNGKPMIQEGEGNVPEVERLGGGQSDIPAPLPNYPEGVSGCICLAELIPESEGICFWRNGKLF
jgi:hypothetical protein